MTESFEPVVLLDKNNAEYTARSAAEYNSLVNGEGYRVKEDTSTVDGPELDVADPVPTGE